MTTSNDPSQLDQYLQDNGDRHLEALFALLRIPSVSTDPTHKGDVRRCAEHLVATFAALGFECELMETPGHPIVYAEWLNAPGRPTALFYGHYDVQPPDPLELWSSPPFEPTLDNGDIVARGTSDDKGQVFAHILAAEALLAVEGQLPLNLKFMIEGEEECGSVNLVPFLEANQERLAADIVLISDTTMFDPQTPSICYGLRGLAYQQIDVYGPRRDLHSGMFGGAIDNPINALCHIISMLKDPSGVTRIPGFYDDVRPLSDEDRAELARLPFDEPAFLAEAGAVAHGEPGYTTLERIGARPTLDVNGMWGGFIGQGAKTVLPAEAHAKVSMRLVPDQRPEDIGEKLTRYVKDIAPPGVRLEIKSLHGGYPSITDRSSPFVKAAARALERVFDKPPVFVREGGSIPVVSDIKRILGTDSILAGFGLSSDRIHSPNERLAVDRFRAAARFGVRVWGEMAGLA